MTDLTTKRTQRKRRPHNFRFSEGQELKIYLEYHAVHRRETVDQIAQRWGISRQYVYVIVNRVAERLGPDGPAGDETANAADPIVADPSPVVTKGGLNA